MPSLTSWIAAAAAIAVVAVIAILSIHFWGGIGDTHMSLGGWVAMVLGILVAVALGVGLMALMFISSRGGYDE
ncbi:MAG: hypothetical protein JO267_01795 [Alphaproteobacteria bacterium]|nr:hypothetical protein [Alphaproteobacteria bacterium]MBV9860860.1 hypothetical protein [Alphaproteobacteria bacterium]